MNQAKLSHGNKEKAIYSCCRPDSAGCSTGSIDRLHQRVIGCIRGTCEGNATITLVGTNVVNGCGNGYPGIEAGGEGTTLTIKGTGSLTATGGDSAAGIGREVYGSCGTISISGGTITATGGMYAAGIGSGYYGTCGNICISGGTITATGGVRAAGIGSGHNGSCGNITISGTASGSATGGNGSAYDIGPGKDGTCGSVSVQENTISGSYYVPPTLASCTFTVNFQTNGNLVKIKTDKITINCEGKNYTALSTDEVNTYIRNESVVKADLPVGANLSLTFTAECITLNGSTPAGTYSATLTNVRITEGSENNLGIVNFVKQ